MRFFSASIITGPKLKPYKSRITNGQRMSAPQLMECFSSARVPGKAGNGADQNHIVALMRGAGAEIWAKLLGSRCQRFLRERLDGGLLKRATDTGRIAVAKIGTLHHEDVSHSAYWIHPRLRAPCAAVAECAG